MDFQRLKELVKKLGGVLVLDGDKPEFVILSYDNYQQKIEVSERDVIVEVNGEASSPARLAEYPAKRASETGNLIDPNEDEKTVERLNQEISVLKEEIRQKEEAELTENEQFTEPIVETVDFD